MTKLLLCTRAAAAMLLAACPWGCRPTRAAAPRNVLLICIDTLRADHLSCYGHVRETTPNLDALAERSSLFEDVRSSAGWTKPSVPSFLTGTHPLEHGVYLGSSDSGAGRASDVLPEASITLAEVFQDAGYRTGAFVKNAQLARGLGFEQGFDTYEDQAGDAREVRWKAQDWLEERDPEQPFFLYLHLLDAHWPWPVPESARTRWADPQALAAFWRDDWSDLRAQVEGVDQGEARAEVLRDVYDGAIRYVDEQLGLLFAQLEQEGLADDTVVCIVSDHGEEFLEHGRIGHGHGLADELLRVPWILHLPGQPAARHAAPASLVDLFPTLIAAAGLAPSQAGTTSGVDRTRTPDLASEPLAEHLEPGRYARAVVDRGRKLVRTVERAALLADLPAEPPRPRGRFKARLEPDAQGAYVAVRLTPADPKTGATELKGVAGPIAQGSFELCGLQVLLDPLPELYGETHDANGAVRGLVPGMLVKARGALDEAGHFRAEKLKLYAEQAEPEWELRGEVGAFDPRGAVVVGGVSLEFDPERVELELAAHAPRLAREHLVRWFEPAAERPEARDASFDLARDPAERDARAHDPFGLGTELEQRSQAYFQRRVWGAGDRASLTDDALEALRALGYAE